MNTKIKFLTLAGAMACSSIAFGINAMTLEQTVEKAILSNPEVGARFHDFQSSLEGKNVARGALLPEVNVSGWTGREWQGGTSSSASSNWNRRGYTLELRQLLFDGFSTRNQVRQLGLEKLSGYYELLATVDQVALEAAQAHIDVLRYRELEELAQENYQIHQSTLEHIKERQDSGVGRGVDLEQAYGRQALAQTNLMVESGNLNNVLQRYQRIVGISAPSLLVSPPSVEADLPQPDTTKTFVAVLLKNPQLLAKQALVQAAKAGKDVARGRFSPTIELRASTGRDKNPNPANPNYRDAQSSNVQLTASYNLYRGGADSARVRQTAAQEYAARDVRDYTCRNMQQELNVAWNTITQLRSQLPFLIEHELATSRVRVAYMQQFQIGQRSLLDVLDTENELFDARRALANARYDLQKAELQWLMYAHKLLPALGLAQPYQEQPEEIKELELTEEMVEACVQAIPDTNNLKPIRVNYREQLQPPVLTTPSWQ